MFLRMNALNIGKKAMFILVFPLSHDEQALP